MKISCVIFDLGGVLIELDGLPVSPEKSRLTEDEIWAAWLNSTAVRMYESGKINKTQFADQLIAEFELTQTASEFLHYFEHWPKGYFAGVEALLTQLKSEVPLTFFSNTNELHFNRFYQENRFDEFFTHQFSSFQMGLMKPDPESFQFVVDELNLPVAELLFLDDNQLNVEAARRAGLKAELTKGITEVEAHLKHYNLL